MNISLFSVSFPYDILYFELDFLDSVLIYVVLIIMRYKMINNCFNTVYGFRDSSVFLRDTENECVREWIYFAWVVRSKEIKIYLEKFQSQFSLISSADLWRCFSVRLQKAFFFSKMGKKKKFRVKTWRNKEHRSYFFLLTSPLKQCPFRRY